MKIAYLITAYDQPGLLHRIVEALDCNDSFFYIHVDKKIDISPFLDGISEKGNVYFLTERTSVNWMGFSQVESILRLLRQARQINFDFCVLLSGSDYPIKSNKFIHEFFDKYPREYITFWRLDDRPSWKHKIQFFFPIDWISIYGYSKDCEPSFWIRFFWGRFFKYQKYMPKRNFLDGLTPYGGSDWWSLSRDCVDYILRYVDAHPEFVKFYRFTHCPSEMFFHTIILNSHFRKRVQNYCEYVAWSVSTSVADKQSEKCMLVEDAFNLRYIDWSGNKTLERETPAVLDERDWGGILSSADLFARKFHPVRSAALLDRIDREILSRNGGNSGQRMT